MGRHKKQWNGSPKDKRPLKKQEYSDTIRENATFEAFYQRQGIVKNNEWDSFLLTLREPLPAAFRITGSKGQSLQLRNIIRDEIFSQITSPTSEDSASEHTNPSLKKDEIQPTSSKVASQENAKLQTLSVIKSESDKSNTMEEELKAVPREEIPDAASEPLKPPRCLSWYPNGLAWQLEYSRISLRNNKGLKKLHNFLVSESESGNISRQEAVSMIPPLLMDIQQQHRVLDLCAAPGSKTSQIIEYLHGNSSNPIPDGMVIANDADGKRCYMMSHQLNRLQSPNVMVINHDASKLPNMFCINKETGKREPLLFDRILSDVPCSGDGTIRKNPEIWRSWGPGQAVNLHSLQKGVLKRGLELLKAGGRLVYSTCSFNPMENEAVIAYMLNECEGSVSLVDCSDKLPGLVRISGLATWQVKLVKSGEWFQTYKDVPENKRTQVRSSMFPPDNIQELNIQRCLRIAPHHQNTGGFFIAVLEKSRELPWMASKEPKQEGDANNKKTADKTTGDDEKFAEDQPTDQSALSEPPQKKARYQGSREDPFNYLNADDETWQSIRNFFGITPEFDPSWLMVRSQAAARKRQIYLSAPAIKDLVLHNSEKLRFINTGVKLMNRSEHNMANCSYTVSQEGIQRLVPYLDKQRLITLNQSDCIQMLSTDNPMFSRLSPEARDQFKDLGVGGCVCTYNHTDSAGIESDIALTGWRGVTSCRLYVQKYDRHHYLRLCGVDPDKVLQDDRISKRHQSTDESKDKQAEESRNGNPPGAAIGETDSNNHENSADNLGENVKMELVKNRQYDTSPGGRAALPNLNSHSVEFKECKDSNEISTASSN